MLLDRNVPFDTQLLPRIFNSTVRDIATVCNLCRVRFLVGKCDRLVNPADAQACATRFPDGACYVVPGLGHGTSNHGLSFTDHVRYFLVTQLGDWRK